MPPPRKFEQSLPKSYIFLLLLFVVFLFFCCCCCCCFSSLLLLQFWLVGWPYLCPNIKSVSTPTPGELHSNFLHKFSHKIKQHISSNVHVVVQFYHWFSLFLCMVMYDNEYKTKENKNGQATIDPTVTVEFRK